MNLASEEKEINHEEYYIPDNYEDSGGVLGGHFSTRNATELALICGPLAFLELKTLHFSIETNLIIMIVTLAPLSVLCAFGVAGESISQIILAIIRFQRKRRKLSYISFTDSDGPVPQMKKRLDSCRDMLANKQLFGPHAKKWNTSHSIKDDHTKQAPQVAMDDDKPSRSERHRPSQRHDKNSHLMNAALKEMLLRKLELGEDEEDEE